MVYCFVLLLWWLWSAVAAVHSVRRAWFWHRILAHTMHLPDEDLAAAEWGDILGILERPQVRRKLSALGMDTSFPGARIGKRTQGLLLPQYVAARIMQRDNFMVGLVNEGLLDLACTLRLPCHAQGAGCTPHVGRAQVRAARGGACPPPPRSGPASPLHTHSTSPRNPPPLHLARSNSCAAGRAPADHAAAPAMPPPSSLPVPASPWACHCPCPLTHTLHWNVRTALLDVMLEPGSGRLLPAYTKNSTRLRRNLAWISAFACLSLPLRLPVDILRHIIQHAEDWHAKKDVLGPRGWSHAAEWAFRELNELPHLFRRRLNAGLVPATTYLRQFPNATMAVVGKGVAFLAGTVMLALLLLTLVDDQLLLHVTLGDRNLLWYLAMASAVLAAARSLVPAPEETVVNPTEAMGEVVAFTHFAPAEWEGRAGTAAVRDAFMDLFPFRLASLLQEVASVAAAPLVCAWLLPLAAPDITDFLRQNVTEVQGVGAVCTPALFGLAGPPPAPWAREKLQRSILSFHAAHPAWSLAVQQQFQQSLAASALPGLRPSSGASALHMAATPSAGGEQRGHAHPLQRSIQLHRSFVGGRSQRPLAAASGARAPHAAHDQGRSIIMFEVPDASSQPGSEDGSPGAAAERTPTPPPQPVPPPALAVNHEASLLRYVTGDGV